jgi:hypothetical protein
MQLQQSRWKSMFPCYDARGIKSWGIIEMSKPTSDPDKSVEESVTKSCCGGKDRQHNNDPPACQGR